MKVGGRRQLTVPAHLAYGNQSPTPLIKPGETLIFVVDLLGV
jgi:FKBP-type peptidyl-prolyl cis-trans isomerase